MSTKFSITNNPHADQLWKGIGGHFDSLSQIIHEFIDNAISNFKGNNVTSRNIVITFEDLVNKILVTIEDQGTRIKNLDDAFCLGNTNSIDSPLNEHGFGMKHALASANPGNDNWAIYTRTIDDFKNNQFKKISSSYKINDYSGDILSINEETWPRQFNGSGTFVKFTCKKEMFNTLKKNIPGPPPKDFEKYLDYFEEDLGFVYSNILKGQATITISTKKRNRVVQSVVPKWKEFIGPKNGSENNVDLGEGGVTIDYEFGTVEDSKYYKFYKANPNTFGIEIRINGRVLSYNIFQDVWNLLLHTSYNQLLVRLDIKSDDKKRLPTTRTSKNGIREGDGKLEKLYEWLRKKYPKPERSDDPRYRRDELDLFQELGEAKKIHLRGSNVSTEQHIFTAINDNARIDLYVEHLSNVTIYEGKTDITSIKDVYQLRLYWDGCICDGITPNEAILISADHPESVIKLVEFTNKMKDYNDNNYNFSYKTWKEEGINYPK
jgi:hypothetical protein